MNGFTRKACPEDMKSPNEPPRGKPRGIQDLNPYDRRSRLRGIYIPQKRDTGCLVPLPQNQSVV
jgi:hypothetical protein